MNPLLDHHHLSITQKLLLLINFPKAIEEEIRSFKRTFKNELGQAERIDSVPHITLSYFYVQEKYLPSIQKAIEGFFSGIAPFSLDMTGFKAFDNNRLLFLDIHQQSALSTLSQMVNKIIKIAVPEAKFKNRLKYAHTTIARSRKENNGQFIEAKRRFLEIPYARQFHVSSIVLYDQTTRQVKGMYTLGI